MTTQHNNPFVLPGQGQGGDPAKNPLMASMEMMQQAWRGLAQPGGLTQPGLAAPMTLEDMDRRIAELRTVENWLRMNLSMLSSSIQGLEVQRATVATIKSFISPASDQGAPQAGPSPLEAALGIKPSGQAKIHPAHAPDAPGGEAPRSSDAAAPPPSFDAAQGWWNMLQTQFDALAAATTASMQAGEASQARTAGKTPSSRAPAKTAVKSASSKSAGGPGAAPARKSKAAAKKAPRA